MHGKIEGRIYLVVDKLGIQIYVADFLVVFFFFKQKTAYEIGQEKRTSTRLWGKKTNGESCLP